MQFKSFMMFSLFGIILCLSVKAIKQVYSGANGVLLVWETWVLLRIYDFVPAFGLGMSGLKPLQYSAIAFGFVIDVLATLLLLLLTTAKLLTAVTEL